MQNVLDVAVHVGVGAQMVQVTADVGRVVGSASATVGRTACAVRVPQRRREARDVVVDFGGRVEVGERGGGRRGGHGGVVGRETARVCPLRREILRGGRGGAFLGVALEGAVAAGFAAAGSGGASDTLEIFVCHVCK